MSKLLSLKPDFFQAGHFLRLFVCRVQKLNDNEDRDGNDVQDDDSNVNEDGLLMLSHSCASSTRLRHRDKTIEEGKRR